MPETEHSQENIAYIRTHVDRIESLTRFAIASNPDATEFVREHLRGRDSAADFYLAIVDGPKSAAQLATHLGCSPATVSRIGNHLFNQGIVGKVPDPTNRKAQLFVTTNLETMLNVSRLAKQVQDEQRKKQN